MGTGPMGAWMVTPGDGQLGLHLLVPIWEVMMDPGDRGVASTGATCQAVGREDHRGHHGHWGRGGRKGK